MISIKDKIRGMFLGIQIGDCLGMPVETYTREKIKEKYDFLTDYVAPKDHKWFDPEKHPAGSYTDDTQLTLAVARGILDSEGFDICAQIERHIEALENNDSWGGSTRTAVEYLRDNWQVGDIMGWVEATLNRKPGMGLGNGVSMKIAPVAALWRMKRYRLSEAVIMASQLDTMTHNTAESLMMAAAHMQGINYCLSSQPKDFDAEQMSTMMGGAALLACDYARNRSNLSKIISSIELIMDCCSVQGTLSTLATIGGHGKDRFQVLNSIPVVYYCFARDPLSPNCIYTAVNAGGDTDTNASMVGALLGALHGESIFPEHLVKGLNQAQRQEVAEVADAFCQLGGCTPELVGAEI